MTQRFRPKMTTKNQVRSESNSKFSLFKFFVWFIPVIMIGFMYFMDMQLRPSVRVASTAIARHVAAEALNEALSAELAKGEQTRNLVFIHRQTDKENTTIAEFNLQAMAKLQSEATARVNDVLEHLESQEMKLPVTQVVGGTIFSFADLTMPIKLSMIGTANSSVYADVKSVGVNQTVHILYLSITADVNVITPFVSEPIHLETKTPVAYLVLSGTVPNVYYNEGEQPLWNKPFPNNSK